MSDPRPASTELAADPAPGWPGLDRRAGLGALLCLAAAVLTVIGSTQVLAIARQWFAGVQELTLTVTAWDMVVTEIGRQLPDDGAPPNGALLLVAAVLLVAAAALLAIVATRPSAHRLGRAAGLTVVVAATFLVATAGNVALQARWWAAAFERVGPEPPPPDSGAEATVGPGVWTALVAAGLAVAAAVVAWRAAPKAVDPARVEPDTPVLGIPVGVRRLPDAPPDAPS